MLAEKLKPDAEPKPEGAAAADGLSEAANENEEAEGAGETPNPEEGGAVEALPKPVVGGADVEPNPDDEGAKLKLLSWSDAPKLLLPNPNEGAESVEPNPVEEPCGALLFSSLSKAARVVAFIILSS